MKKIKKDDWEKKLDKFRFCCGGDICCGGYPECQIKFGSEYCGHDERERKRLRRFIRSILKKQNEIHS